MGPFVFLDIESTGVDCRRDHLIEVACIRWQDGEILDRFESLVHPQVQVPKEIVMLTGITDEMLKTAPLFKEIQGAVTSFIGGAPIIGHNIAFDMGFLKNHCPELNNKTIDTLALARILLRKESSYALEVLMKKYGLPLQPSHRAMADTETTLNFFTFLAQKIAELPPETRKTIQPVLEKSAWTGACVFLDTPPLHRHAKNAGEKASSAALHTPSSRTADEEWDSGIENALLNEKKLLIESPLLLPSSLLKKEPLVIAYSGARTRDTVITQATALGRSALVFKESHFYLSPRRLAETLARPSFNAEETPFLLKMALWSAETQFGDREEIALEREEYGMFPLFADIDGSDIFWKKSIEAADKADIILVHHQGLARGLCNLLASQKKRSLVIADGQKLEESFTHAYQVKYSETMLRPYFGEKATILAGFLGIFYERHVAVDAGGFRGNVIVDARTRESIEWKRLMEAISNLPEHPKKDEMLGHFAPDSGTVQWVSSFADEVAFHRAPIALGDVFHAHTSPFERVIIHGDALGSDPHFTFTRETFELGADWQEKPDEKATEYLHDRLQISIPENFPEPMTEGYFTRCKTLFSEIIETKKGRALFLLSSKKMIEAIHTALAHKAQACDIKLLSVGPSGGTGKTVALFRENSSSSIIVATAQILPYLSEIEDLVETVVFQRIPFDPPGDPLIAARGAQFENAFKEYTLPRAVLKFRGILSELARSSSTVSPKRCVILDSRITSRDYGTSFLK